MKRWGLWMLVVLMMFSTFGSMAMGSEGSSKRNAHPPIYYAKEFGAVGDGMTDDGPALRHAFETALADTRGAVRLVLEPGKTYRIATERMDRWPYFIMSEVKNFTFEGNGSTLLMAKPVNSFFRVENSKNIRIQGLTLDYEETSYTQGTITAVDQAAASFEMTIHDGFPLPIPTTVQPRPRINWGSVFDPVKPHAKWGTQGVQFVNEVIDLGDRKYRIKLDAESAGQIRQFAPNDRFVLRLRFNQYYDLESRKSGGINNINVVNSENIRIEDVTMYASLYMGINVQGTEGHLIIRNVKQLRKPGTERLISTTSDGLHLKNNRTGPIIENNVFDGNLDDAINNGTFGNPLLEKISDMEFRSAPSFYVRAGDQLQFYNRRMGSYLGTANVTEVVAPGRVKMDASVLGAATAQNQADIFVFNLSASGNGYEIRNNTFMNGRRFGVLMRAQDGVIENNVFQEMTGSGIYASPELGGFQEGPIPKNLAIRGNRFTNNQRAGLIVTNVPPDSDRVIENILIENNRFEASTSGAIALNAISGLTMTGNQISIVNPTAANRETAVTIFNTENVLINGLSITDPRTNVAQAMLISGSDLTNATIGNITTDLGGDMIPYTVIKETADVLLDDFETGLNGWTAYAPHRVNQVNTMTNPPRGAYTGEYLLEITPSTTVATPANQWRGAYKTFDGPIDATANPVFRASLNTFGYAGVSSLEAKVEVFSGAEVFTKVVSIQGGTWTIVTADLSGWDFVDRIDQVAISYRIPSVTGDWKGRHQIDHVGFDRKY